MLLDTAPVVHEALKTMVFVEQSHRIVGEIRGINRVGYDISGKPATIEWE